MIRHQRRAWPALAALIALYVLLALLKPHFFDFENLRELLLSNCSLLLVATGMTLVIVIGQIDISVGSLFAVTGVLAAEIAKLGMPMLLLPLCAIVLGFALGCFNGSLIAFVPAPSIVVTLATMVIFRQTLNWWKTSDCLNGRRRL
jgi:rhamnose transport system permease protein